VELWLPSTLEFVVIISVETLHLKVNKYDCLRVSCTDATPRWVKKTRQKYREKPNQLSKKPRHISCPRKKKRKNIYIYTTRPDSERPPQLVHGFHPSIFPTLTHPKHRTSNSYTKSTAQWQYSAYDVVWIRRNLVSGWGPEVLSGSLQTTDWVPKAQRKNNKENKQAKRKQTASYPPLQFRSPRQLSCDVGGGFDTAKSSGIASSYRKTSATSTWSGWVYRK